LFNPKNSSFGVLAFKYNIEPEIELNHKILLIIAELKATAGI
jgi:hypothetical protein